MAPIRNDRYPRVAKHVDLTYVLILMLKSLLTYPFHRFLKKGYWKVEIRKEMKKNNSKQTKLFFLYFFR